MHSLRRAALRSALSASRAITTKPQTIPFAAQWIRAADAPLSPALVSCRSFTQTLRVASDAEDAVDRKTIEEAIQSASEVGSSSSDVEALSSDIEGLDATTSDSPAADSAFKPASSGGESSDFPPNPRSLETPYGLFVRNMVFEAEESHLTEAFSKFGEVAHAIVARDPRGLSKGFGFVYFTNPEAVEKAVAESNGSFWHGRRIAVAPRMKSTQRTRGTGAEKKEPTKSLFIGNIPYETTDAELNRLFRELENVTDVRIAVDRTTGWPRGFAHADFTDPESTERAMKQLSNITIGGRKLRLDYADGVQRDKRNLISDTPPEFTVKS